MTKYMFCGVFTSASQTVPKYAFSFIFIKRQYKLALVETEIISKACLVQAVNLFPFSTACAIFG